MVIQEPWLSQRPDIADPAVQPHLSAERGSGCWITAAITLQTPSSAGCDQSCCSGRRGLVAVPHQGLQAEEMILCISQGFTALIEFKVQVLILEVLPVIEVEYHC